MLDADSSAASSFLPEDHVLDLRDTRCAQVALTGGKGARLGELSRIDGIRVPAGYCVTTDAFRLFMDSVPAIDDRLDRLARLNPADRAPISSLSSEIRGCIEGIRIPDELAAAITRPLARFGAEAAFAVRSSATAEDSPAASFAGQHDTYLNVVGPTAILEQVRRCWASLFTERAVTYRLRNGFSPRGAAMAVVVQQMVPAAAAGVVVTADPVTANRKVTVVEAVHGLGEGLVSGATNPDVYQVRDGKAVTTTRPGGQPVLTDAQVRRLARLGRRIEAHFGHPQDIEWCLAGGEFHIVQSRPLTALFPVPVAGDRENHVYISVGHQQMMTDAMKPMGLSVWQLTALRPMCDAGGRLCVDATESLVSHPDALLDAMGKSDPLIRDALRTVLDRGDFIPTRPAGNPSVPRVLGKADPIDTDPGIVTGLIARTEDSIAALDRDIETKSGPELFEFILADLQELKRLLTDPLSVQVIMTVMDTTWWLGDRLREWLGENQAADTLIRSAPGNVSSEMGLALLDVADVIRPHPAVVAFLRRVDNDDFLDDLVAFPGGLEARDAIRGYLGNYGMRCAGEIDITRPRWSERPSTLLPMLLGHIRNFEPGARGRHFEQGRQEAQKKTRELLERLRVLPDGERKADETKRKIEHLRTFVGYREFPKYGMISRYFRYKQALLKEAGRQVRAGLLRAAEDIFYLRFEEFHDAVRTGEVDDELIQQRKADFRTFQALTPPRVLTSDGEAVAGAYRREDVPAGALAGLPVSAGQVEGRARVVLDMADADLEAGDILVTTCTDPSWSPLFVTIAGLVTEVGGQMTHGAVITREYGLPAVVGVEHATRLIRDGQRIRVDGTGGYVEILPAP